MIVHPRSSDGTTPGPFEATFPDDDLLPGRTSAVLIGVVGLVGVITFGCIVGIPHVERHLRSDVEIHALLGTDVNVRFDGRVAVLSGFVRSSDERRAVIDRVARRWGVARVAADRLDVRAGSITPARNVAPGAGASGRRGSPEASVESTAAVAGPTVKTPVPVSSTPPSTTASAPPSTTATRIAIDETAIGGLAAELASIRRSSPITFARSSPSLLASAQTALDRIAAALSKTPVPVRIEAHTDASGNPGRNAVLSTQRAEAVRAALILRGISPSIVSAVGRGESSPIASNASAAGRERNRRVEFIVLRPEQG